MDKITKKVEEIDSFKVEKTFNTEANSEDKELGSVPGGLCTLTNWILLVTYLVISLIQMHNGENDVQTDRSRPNYLLDGENVIKVFNSTFLPTLELYWALDENRENSIDGKHGIIINELLYNNR